jgi:hypothetical protein
MREVLTYEGGVDSIPSVLSLPPTPPTAHRAARAQGTRCCTPRARTATRYPPSPTVPPTTRPTVLSLSRASPRLTAPACHQDAHRALAAAVHRLGAEPGGGGGAAALPRATSPRVLASSGGGGAGKLSLPLVSARDKTIMKIMKDCPRRVVYPS